MWSPPSLVETIWSSKIPSICYVIWVGCIWKVKIIRVSQKWAHGKAYPIKDYREKIWAFISNQIFNTKRGTNAKIRWKIYYICIRINFLKILKGHSLHACNSFIRTNSNHHVVFYVKLLCLMQICINFIICITFMNLSVNLFMQVMDIQCKRCSWLRHYSMMGCHRN